MINFKLYPAVVIDNNDEQKAGRVKIRINALMNDVKKSDLPWASTFSNNGGGSNSHGVSNIPEIDSQVYVFFMDDVTFDNCFYMADMQFTEKHGHKLFEENVKANVSFESNYPDVKYIYLKNGITLAMSSSDETPEISIYHPSAQITIDKDGNTLIEGNKNEINLDNNGITIKDNNSNTIIMDAMGITITGGKTLTVNGAGVPNGQGCFLGIKNCLFTGAPISTNQITGI